MPSTVSTTAHVHDWRVQEDGWVCCRNCNLSYRIRGNSIQSAQAETAGMKTGGKRVHLNPAWRDIVLPEAR